MLYGASIAVFEGGRVRVGETLDEAEALWIEPYRAVGVASPVAGSVDVYASFDGETYFMYAPGVHLDQGSLRSWTSRIPARWLKFVGQAIADPIPDGTLLEWGGKS